MNDKLTWLDIETFGLDSWDPIIEIGIVITDLELEPIAENSYMIWGDRHRRRYDEMLANQWQNESDSYVLDMHRKNNLFEEAQKHGERTLTVVDTILSDWLEWMECKNLPIVGNSVHQDRVWLRSQMPRLYNTFHYRIIDNSTIKELARRYAPQVYSNLPAKDEQHRVIPDLYDSIEEFRYYRDNFLKVGIDLV